MLNNNRLLNLLLVMLLLTVAACTAKPASPATPTVPPLARELVFLDWAGDMPQPVLDAFSAEYGVKVSYLTYESQEEAIENIKAGKAYDVVVMESRFLPLLAQAGLLAEIDYRYVPNFKNVSANFRDLAYDPGNRYSVPFNWGTTGLLVRSDLVTEPVKRWADLWDKRYAGRVALWAGQRREVLALTLKSLGYSANSETPAELEAALKRLIDLKPNLLFIEDYDPVTSATMLASGKAVIAMGYAGDMLRARELKLTTVQYILPEEGALLWGDNFIIPANSASKYTAELFLDFLLRPKISAQITNLNKYPIPNAAAGPFIDPEISSDPVIFPPDAALKSGQIIMPLSATGQKLYDDIWARFMAAGR